MGQSVLLGKLHRVGCVVNTVAKKSSVTQCVDYKRVGNGRTVIDRRYTDIPINYAKRQIPEIQVQFCIIVWRNV